jgi:hypothetical protein
MCEVYMESNSIFESDSLVSFLKNCAKAEIIGF